MVKKYFMMDKKSERGLGNPSKLPSIRCKNNDLKKSSSMQQQSPQPQIKSKFNLNSRKIAPNQHQQEQQQHSGSTKNVHLTKPKGIVFLHPNNLSIMKHGRKPTKLLTKSTKSSSDSKVHTTPEERAAAVISRRQKFLVDRRRRRLENPFNRPDRSQRKDYGRSAKGRRHFRNNYSYSSKTTNPDDSSEDE